MTLNDYLTKEKNYTDKEAKEAIISWENDLIVDKKIEKDCYEWWNNEIKRRKNG